MSYGKTGGNSYNSIIQSEAKMFKKFFSQRKARQLKQARMAKFAKCLENGLTRTALEMLAEDGNVTAVNAINLLDIQWNAEEVMHYDPKTRTTTFTFKVTEEK
jgi:hypothetical protein